MLIDTAYNYSGAMFTISSIPEVDCKPKNTRTFLGQNAKPTMF